MVNTMRNGMFALIAIALLALFVSPLQAAGVSTGVLADLVLPEPASLGLLALGSVALLLRRRKH